jgi:uncharacterized protein YndB with AHSA1/START domain
MSDAASREISITRIVEAPPELVFEAWTEAEHLAKWWGPEGFTVPSAESDPRPGGAFAIVMRGPDGTDYPMSGVYRELDPPRRLVADSRALDAEGRALLEAVTTVTFADLGGKTELTVAERAVALVPEAAQMMLGGMEVGMIQSLRRLEDVLTGTAERQIVLLHLYEFPRERMFEAWTSPEHLARWWGPSGFTTTTDAFDLRPGGAWRFTMHGPDGVDYPNLIVFDEIDPPALLSYEHSGQPDDDPRFHVTVTFDDFLGMTVLTSRMVFANADARDLVVDKYGAIEGGNQTMDRLGVYLASG